MTRYILRLDDACERMDLTKWNKVEDILDKYSIKPLVGVIAKCEDKDMNSYSFNCDFWNLVDRWLDKNWDIGLHGFNHVYSSNCGGINPVHKRSEFAGLPLAEQKEKMKNAIAVFSKHGIHPKVFIAPSHTFDSNTLLALKEETNIQFISDTVAWKPYFEDGFVFVPQQSGHFRKLHGGIFTFCYHPNTMSDDDFLRFENFISKYRKLFIKFPDTIVKRKKNLFDKMFNWLYFAKRK